MMKAADDLNPSSTSIGFEVQHLNFKFNDGPLPCRFKNLGQLMVTEGVLSWQEGFNPYTTVVITTRAHAQAHAEELKHLFRRFDQGGRII